MATKLYLTDEQATALHHSYYGFREELKEIAGANDKATVNVWWLLHRLEDIDHSVVWGFREDEMALPFPEVGLDYEPDDEGDVLPYPLDELPEGEDAFWEAVKKNLSYFRDYQETENDRVLASELYEECSPDQLITMQMLLNSGFNLAQVKALKGLIVSGYDHDEIKKLFNYAMSDKEIGEFADRLIKIKLKNEQKEND